MNTQLGKNQNMEHELMTAPKFANNFAGQKWNIPSKEKHINTYIMGPAASDKCSVTAHAPQVYGYAPPGMMCMLYNNLWPPKDTI